MNEPTTWTNRNPGDLADGLPDVSRGDVPEAVRRAAEALLNREGGSVNPADYNEMHALVALQCRHDAALARIRLLEALLEALPSGHGMKASVCVRVSACARVCERESEREKEKARERGRD